MKSFLNRFKFTLIFEVLKYVPINTTFMRALNTVVANQKNQKNPLYYYFSFKSLRKKFENYLKTLNLKTVILVTYLVVIRAKDFT